MARKRNTNEEEVGMVEAAHRLGMTQQGVGMWAQREGAPVVLKGGRRYCLWPAYPIWYRQQLQKASERPQEPADFEKARAEKTQAEAELAKIELAKARDELVTVAAFRTHVEQIASTLRAQLLSVPGRYAARTIALESLVESQRVWDLAIRGVLAELSGEGVPLPEEDAA